jgi:hypothetical protein
LEEVLRLEYRFKLLNPRSNMLVLLLLPVPRSIIETYGKKVEPKELEEVLRMEYRSKLLNVAITCPRLLLLLLPPDPCPLQHH